MNAKMLRLRFVLEEIAYTKKNTSLYTETKIK